MGGWWVVGGGWWEVGGWWVGGGEWLWVLVVGGSTVGNEPLSSCDIVDTSKVVRTHIHIIMIFH